MQKHEETKTDDERGRFMWNIGRKNRPVDALRSRILWLLESVAK